MRIVEELDIGQFAVLHDGLHLYLPKIGIRHRAGVRPIPELTSTGSVSSVGSIRRNSGWLCASGLHTPLPCGCVALTVGSRSFIRNGRCITCRLFVDGIGGEGEQDKARYEVFAYGWWKHVR